jgi:hypothetical protein
MSRRLDLSSVWAKYHWAVEHAESLHADIARWANGKADSPVVFDRKYHPERHEISFWVKSVKPPKDEWALMLGDTLYNFRATLDHLAWALVRSAGGKPLTDEEEKAVQFPICRKKPEDFDATCKRRLPRVGLRRRRLLSPFQPYSTRPRQGRELLWLSGLNNVDKHRTMLTVLLRPLTYEYYAVGDFTFEAIMPPSAWRPFEPNTEAITLRVTPWTNPEPDVRVYFDAARQVSLRDAAAPQRLGLVDILGSIQQYVARVVGKFILV